MKRVLIFFLLAVMVGALSYRIYQKSQASVQLQTTTFDKLPGWRSSSLHNSLAAFLHSCEAFKRQPQERDIGTTFFPLKVQGMLSSCIKASALVGASNAQIRHFFEDNFYPMYFTKGKPETGVFTGYYVPLLYGSFVPTERYRYPIYGVPEDLITVDVAQFKLTSHRPLVGRLAGQHLVPYHTREEINQGALSEKAKPLVWVDDRIDRFFLEIQGSGIIVLPDKEQLVIGYAAQNGHEYTAVGRVLIGQGVISKENMSMQAIRHYLTSHPDMQDAVLHQNKSTVFFRRLEHSGPLGAQGVELTPQVSLAVDKRYIPYGLPVWLDTYYSDAALGTTRPLQRLMVAQDTGGAIKGRVRGDVFWGAGTKASEIAGKMNSRGRYWILMPK